MTFARVELLLLIWIVPLLALVYVYGRRKRRRILNAFADPRTRDRIAPAGMERRRRLAAVLVLTAAALTVAALAGPRYGFQWQEVERRGIDIIIALDCSRSMLAADIQPTRLDRAKREIYDLLAMLQGDRVGLVAFSGTAFLQCPLTIDYSAFHLFLDALTPDYLPVGGTDMAQAVQSAQEAFDPESSAEKAVILITDGEHTGSGDPLAAARAAEKAGIRLFCIGVGSGEGVPVPESQGGFKKDRSGQIILSRLDEEVLTRMALVTGGSYVRSVAGDLDLETVYTKQIRSRMKAATIESGRKQVWADRYQWPLAMAVLLLLAVCWLPPTSRSMAQIVLCAALLALPEAADAGPLQKGYDAYQQGAYDQALKQFIDGQLQDPENPSLLYNLGNALYKTGDFEGARQHYRQALPDLPDGLKARARYNLGNSAYRLGRLPEAIEDYEAALRLSPDDRQARENLEFVKAQLQKQQSQQHQDSEKPNEPSDQRRDKHQGQERQEQSSAEKKPQSEPSAGQPSQTEEQKERAQASRDTREGRGPQPQVPAGTAQMLDRLKDRPGRALMPKYDKQTVEKDW